MPGAALSLDVGQALGDPAISDPDDVHAADMAFSPVVTPAHYRPGRAIGELLLDTEPRLRCLGEHLPPDLAHRVPSLIARAVRRREVD